MQKAVKEDPEFIRNIIKTETSLARLVKAHLIESLMLLQDVNDIALIKDILKTEIDPLVKEACYITLNGYSEIDKSLQDYFNQQYQIELNSNVKQIIQDCLDYQKMMED